MSVEGRQGRISRRAFLGLGGAAAVALGGSSGGPLGALGARVAQGQQPPRTTGYGPLVPKTDGGSTLFLPEEFDFVVLDRQGGTMDDGNPTPGIFDGMGAYRGRGGGDSEGDNGDGRGRTTILIRNHENRERPGEIPVVVPEDKAYDPSTIAGNTKVVVRRGRRGGAPEVVQKFAVLGGTSTNCAGGVTPWGSWLPCEEVVKGPSSGAPTSGGQPVVIGGQTLAAPTKKHGYVFEIPANATEAVEAVPITQAGRLSHEAAAFRGNILYLTEDRSISQGGACLYRYRPERRVRRDGDLAESTGPLEALKLRDEERANMDVGREVGEPYPVEWVEVPVPDHDDDADARLVGPPGDPDNKPTRFQAQDRGAAFFDRQEGMWVDRKGIIYFDCTAGGAQNLGQIWAYDPKRETITLIFESTDPSTLEAPDNIVIVPETGDVFLQEDGDEPQFVRGLTPEGEIYDFAQTGDNGTEFCGGCFDPSGDVFYLNQQGERGADETGEPGGGGTPTSEAVTYAIFGPFSKRRRGNRGRS